MCVRYKVIETVFDKAIDHLRHCVYTHYTNVFVELYNTSLVYYQRVGRLSM